jgi:hypothetical protein
MSESGPAANDPLRTLADEDRSWCMAEYQAVHWVLTGAKLGFVLSTMMVAACSDPTYEHRLVSFLKDCEAEQFASIQDHPFEKAAMPVVDFVTEAEKARPFADCIFARADQAGVERPTIFAGSEHTWTVLEPM